jgi:hypothetical protein
MALRILDGPLAGRKNVVGVRERGPEVSFDTPAAVEIYVIQAQDTQGNLTLRHTRTEPKR